MAAAANGGDHLGQRLVYQATVPVEYQVIETVPDGHEYQSIQIDNEEVLHAIMLIDDAPKERTEDSSAESQEVLRLEHKINLMFELLTSLYQQNTQLPNKLDLELRSDAVEWQSRQAIAADGAIIQLKLHLSPKFPKPITLFGTAKFVAAEEVGTVSIIFDDLVSEHCRDWIDKYIFRHHRRAVALAKRECSTQ